MFRFRTHPHDEVRALPLMVRRGALPSVCCWLAAVSVLLAAAGESAADELTILRAAVEERISGIRSLDVRYRWQQERTPKSPEEILTEELVVHYGRDDRRQCYETHPFPGSKWPASRWYYDGRRTVEFYYSAGKTEPGRIAIFPGPPRSDRLSAVAYLNYTGHRLWWSDRSLSDALRSSSARLKWTTDAAGVRAPLVELTGQDQHGNRVELAVTFDAHTPGLPRILRTSWWQKSASAETGGADPHIGVYTVTDTIDVPDPLSGAILRFPRSGRREVRIGGSLWGAARFEVDELHVNREIPHARFTPELPFGVSVAEHSGKPGELPKKYLVGGKDAMEAAMQERNEHVQREIGRLASEGVQFDASLPGRYGWARWLMYAGVAGCLVALAIRIKRRRA